MTEYTPDEMTAREMYLAGSTLYRETPEQHYLGAPEPDYRAEFDRFLARVRRDAKAEAWDEAYRCGVDDARLADDLRVDVGLGPDLYAQPARNNPYRSADTEKGN